MSEQNQQRTELSSSSSQLASEELIAQAYAAIGSQGESSLPAPTGAPVFLGSDAAPPYATPATTGMSAPLVSGHRQEPGGPAKRVQRNVPPNTSVPRNIPGVPSAQPGEQQETAPRKGGRFAWVAIALLCVFVLPSLVTLLNEPTGSTDSPQGSSGTQNTSNLQSTYKPKEANTVPIRAGSQTVGYVDVPESFTADSSLGETINELRFVDTNNTGYIVTLKVFPESTREDQHVFAEQLKAEIDALERGYADLIDWDFRIEEEEISIDRVNGSYKVGEEYYRFDEYFFTASDGLVHSIRLDEPFETFDVYCYNEQMQSGYQYVTNFSTISMLGSFEVQS